jgi:glycosyltransferase involved in cell wall biosynthesis
VVDNTPVSAARAGQVEISVVAPAYKCGSCIAELHRQVVAALEPITASFELILVNDGCPEDSWEAILAATAADPRVKGINLSRNFGQHYAIAAGVHHAAGQWVVVMDCDLQDRPAEIPRLYARAREGYDVVFALRRSRQDTWLKRTLSRGFSAVYNLLSEIPIHPRACNFSIASRRVIDAWNELQESNRSWHLLLRWLGFRTAYLDVEHSSRHSGVSAYDLRRGVRLALESITSQSNKPLILSIRAGFLMAGAALAAAVYLVIRYLQHGIAVAGWTSVIVSLYFVGGLLLANLGVLGLYLGKVFNQVKQRPLYVVRDLVNFSGDSGSVSADLAGLSANLSGELAGANQRH